MHKAMIEDETRERPGRADRGDERDTGLTFAPSITRRYPVVKAVARARCPECGHRRPWPDGATPADSPLISVMVACPSCHRIIALSPEPPDEKWWQFVTSSSAPPGKAPPPPVRRSCPATRPSAAAPTPVKRLPGVEL